MDQKSSEARNLCFCLTQKLAKRDETYVGNIITTFVYGVLEKMKRVNGKDVLFEKVCVVANPGAVHPA